MIDRWRYLLLAQRIDELMDAALAAHLPRCSVHDPRGKHALEGLGRDPFASAIWSMDQAVPHWSVDQVREGCEIFAPLLLDDAEHYCCMAERELIAHHRRRRWRQSRRGKRLFDRICGLRDAEYRASVAIWQGGVMVREQPFDGARVEQLINAAISSYEDDEPAKAESYCRDAERAMHGGAAHE